jgi:hypothetical protein
MIFRILTLASPHALTRTMCAPFGRLSVSAPTAQEAVASPFRASMPPVA